MSVMQVVVAMVTLIFAAAVQSSVGFGAGIVSLPIFVLCGLSPQQAMGLVLPNNIVQTSVNCWQHRHQWYAESVVILLLCRFVGLVLGIETLHSLLQNPTLVRPTVGGILLIVLAVQRVWKVTPQPKIAWSWTIVAGLLSGYLAGLVMMGGPPLVMWVMAHNWPPNRQRAFLWGQFLLLMPLHTLLLGLQFQGEAWDALGYGCALAPAGWVGALLGNWLVARISHERLRMLMTSMLVLMGISALMSPWWQPSPVSAATSVASPTSSP